MRTVVKRTGAGVAAAATSAALVLAGTGVAGAATLPDGAYFTSDGTSITAHVGQGAGITNCLLTVQHGTDTPLFSQYTSDATITVGGLPPATYTTRLACTDSNHTTADPAVVRSDNINVPPTALDMIRYYFESIGLS